MVQRARTLTGVLAIGMGFPAGVLGAMVVGTAIALPSGADPIIIAVTAPVGVLTLGMMIILYRLSRRRTIE